MFMLKQIENAISQHDDQYVHTQWLRSEDNQDFLNSKCW